MAMFPTHIKCSTALGIGCGAVAHVGYGVPLTTSIVGAGLCSIGGILPDIDSGPGIPLREITTFLASAVPTMLLTRLLSYNFTQETLILAGACIYVGIRFGLSHFLRHYTVHRGMFHSFPAMAIFGELTYLLFYGENVFIRLFMVAAVCLGFLTHLLLDEIYSVEWDGRPHVKNSFGTAMKFIGHGWWPNFTCYAKLAVLTYFVMNDPSVVHQIYTGQGQEVAKSLGQTVKEQFDSALARTRPKSSGDAGFLALIPAGAAKRSSQGTANSAGSTSGGPSSLAWPATVPATSSTPVLVVPQPAVAPAARWSVPADPPGSDLSSNATRRAGTAAPAAGNRPWSTPPSGQAPAVPFWQ